MAIPTDMPAGVPTVPPPGDVRAVEEVLARPGAPLLYRVGEVMGLLGLSRSVVFEQLRDGRLRSVRQGRARRVPATAVLDYVRLLEREAAEGGGT